MERETVFPRCQSLYRHFMYVINLNSKTTPRKEPFLQSEQIEAQQG